MQQALAGLRASHCYREPGHTCALQAPTGSCGGPAGCPDAAAPPLSLALLRKMDRLWLGTECSEASRAEASVALEALAGPLDGCGPEAAVDFGAPQAVAPLQERLLRQLPSHWEPTARTLAGECPR